MFTMCKVCNFTDTKVDNGDCSSCSECCSTEQGFLYLEEMADGSIVDEDGNTIDSDILN